MLEGLTKLVFLYNGEEEKAIIIPSFWWQRHFGDKPCLVVGEKIINLFPLDYRTEGNLAPVSDRTRYVLKRRR